MNLYERIKKKKEKISVVGLGYVGVPLAVEFAKHVDVIGFDINEEKLNQYKHGNDITKEVGNEEMKKTTVEFTCDESKLKESKFHIVAVPTPINSDKTPDLRPVIGATKTLARNLTEGSIVVYESTVYPGTTEEICIPILEEISGLKYGEDFKVGYSPERINPGDKVNKLTTIMKIVSGCDDETLDIVAKVYEIVIEAGVYRAENIKVAEAAKVIENSQRDINIAFMNELAMVFNKMDIDTQAVLRAAGTKWNFLNFSPGLVGGHCIGVDPYYFIYKAEELGYHSQIILSGRKINDGMAKYVVENTIKNLIKAEKQIKGSRVIILGLTFKENCPDTRNTKIIDIVNELSEYGVEIIIYDPIADKEEAFEEYGIELNTEKELKDADAVICTVAHDEFKLMSLERLMNMYSDGRKVLIDIKGLYDRNKCNENNILYWRL
ncbi:UDP-N-acetyl-D-galactosamine dehydrogenase [Paraclostridium bifermentans]|uniref:nucleotide sugar dehydrogenase n=1 Tax=Paraclostridium bifermentans TaxID=1490 RepID=UPI0021C4224B|nr:nucleotide sugar dehydrogenase [Paraclostridium bifermentans]GKZ04400.1 UDP-N-acetyl-D-galactosamine dehydrogenase [Paraclostridium bifermentans]GKZ06786.1 UDP-N-acetyl-D-galactosamine dehydrogenase [Paraclostridium bifermentans]GKZ11302.1 UDP-N-acetyl-D-galactosamine dehydrogenase [Paraclostridium bifermentans]